MALDPGAGVPEFRAAPPVRLRVLVVEDAPLIRDRIVRLLGTMPAVAALSEAIAEAEALEKFSAQPADVVVLDVRLAQGSGVRVLEAVRRMRPEAVVAILTNFPYAIYRRRCMALGADFFLDKATDFERLRDVVAVAVARQARRAHAAANAGATASAGPGPGHSPRAPES